MLELYENTLVVFVSDSHIGGTPDATGSSLPKSWRPSSRSWRPGRGPWS